MHNLTPILSFKTYIRSYVLYFSAVLISATLFNQKLVSQNLIGKNEPYYKESLIFNTDRDIYITGEKIWFNVVTLNSMTNAPTNISKVVYVEFLDKNNFPLKQLKVKVDNCLGSSVFLIPGNLTSGNYVIRAYTSWMQNWPADQYCYRTISVINPFGSFDNLVLRSTDGSSEAVKSYPGTNNTKVGPLQEDDKKINFKIILNKQEYPSREKVKVEIVATDINGTPLESDLSVTIAKSGIINVSGELKSGSEELSGTSSFISKNASPDYLPELEGNLIYGNIRSKETGEPLRNIAISLSYVGKIARCQFSRTNVNGEFYFVVKESGTSEIVIQPLEADIKGYYIDLKQSFNSSFSNYKPPLLKIDSSNLDNINKAVISMQINNLYEPFRQKQPDGPKNRIPDFYGKPENSIVMADYIELTTLREVVREIMPNVYAQKQNGKYDFKLINIYKSQPFEFRPLILMDGVPVYDFEKVLNINSRDIERAEIINIRYFFSDNIFDGIVSFVTKKGNLSAMEFDNTVFRQVYEGCQQNEVFYSPEYSSDSLKSSRIPDYRNTLYWNPDKHTDKDGKTQFEFYTSDESTDYTIVVKGISADGKTGYSTAILKMY
jgi:hypothetical protein